MISSGPCVVVIREENQIGNDVSIGSHFGYMSNRLTYARGLVPGIDLPAATVV